MSGPDPFAATAEGRGRGTQGQDPTAGDQTEASVPARTARAVAAPDLGVVPDGFYSIENEFARGGLGRILRAKDRRLDRTVAVKELISKDPKAEARFTREALITARLQHPNIVPIHEAGRWPQGQRFYSMKLVEGRTLAEALDAAHTREDRLALLPHLVDVADAVAYAHSQGILHRDLKPGNVMVGAFGETVVIDWGLAKDLWGEDELPPSVEPPAEAEASPTSDDVYTSDGIVVGTPPYMPPEQAAAHDVDERSDVYALGAMLYHVLCGFRPYHHVSARDILRAVVSGPPKPVVQLAPELPKDLVAIVSKAMARDPDQRYPSAKEMAEELRRFSAGQLVRAHEYTPLEILARFVRKNFGTVTISLAALLLLVGFGVWSFEALRAERDRAQSAAARERLRSQQLILEEADHLLDEDPTASLAWLLRLDNPARVGATSIASEAEFRGVARWVDQGAMDVVHVTAASKDHLAWAGQNGPVRLLELATGRLRSLPGSHERVTGLSFSSDERYLASGGYDDRIHIWNVDALTDGPRVLGGHSADVKGLKFYQNEDTEYLVSISSRELIFRTLWGAQVAKHPIENANRRLDVVAAGDVVLSGGHGESVRLWSSQGRLLREVRCGNGRVDTVALSPDGESFACGTADGEVRWGQVSGGKLLSFGAPAEPGVLALRFSPDGDALVSTHFDGMVGVHRRGLQSEWLPGHSQRVVAAEFSPDGQWLATAGWDDPVLLTHLASKDTRRLLGHQDTVASLAFSADGKHLVSGSWDGSARVWVLNTTPVRRLSGHQVGVHGVDFSPDGAWLASGGHDNQVRAWKLGEDRVQIFDGHEDHVYRVLFHPAGRWIASSSDDRTVRLWSLDGRAPRVGRGHEADVEELAFSRDGSYLASAGEDDLVMLWSLEGLENSSSELTGVPLRGHRDFVTDVAFFSNDHLASAGRDGAVWLWTLSTEEPSGWRGRKLEEFDGPVQSIDFSPDGRELAVAAPNALVVLEVETGELLLRRPLPDAQQVAYSPNPGFSFIAVASSTHNWWLCERAFERCRQMPKNDGAILDVVFHPERPVLAMGGADTTVRLWDLIREEVQTYRGHQLNVFDVVFSPDGQWLASGSADADVRLWQVQLPPPGDQLHPWIRRRTTYRVDGPDLEGSDAPE